MFLCLCSGPCLSLLSSTGQAEGGSSDCILNPVFSCPDPVRGGDNVLVLCEVLNPDFSPHETNTRRKIADLLSPEVLAQETLFGFEQEYTMFGRNGRIYGWPENGYPDPQVCPLPFPSLACSATPELAMQYTHDSTVIA